LGGFSVFDQKGGSFHDPDGPDFFGEILRMYLQPETPLHLLHQPIHDPEFTKAMIESLERVLK